MGFSNAVMFAIIAVTALTIGKHGHHVNIGSPAQAAESLKPVAGRFATDIFALGFIGSGMLAIPVLGRLGFGRNGGIARSPYWFLQLTT